MVLSCRVREAHGRPLIQGIYILDLQHMPVGCGTVGKKLMLSGKQQS
jgi:hypothetical protein